MSDQVDRIIAAPFKAAYRRYRALSDRSRRFLTISVITPLFIALSAGPALADDGTGALGWVDITDSHGIQISRFGTLSLDRGGVTHAGRLAWSVLTELLWTGYEIFVVICCWLIDWTLSMDWVTWLAGPVMGLGDNLQHIVDKFGLTPTLLTITACVACLWMMRGRWVLGIFELFMSMIIASLAIGVLANPVRLVAGPDGMLTQSRDAGLQIAVGLKNDGNVTGDSEALRKELVAGVADAFLRQPNQIVNYGEILDDKGGDCVKTYDEKVGDDSKDAASDVKDACDIDTDKTGVDPNNPGSAMFMNTLALAPAGLIALLFSAILCGAVLVAGAYALYQSLKLIVALIVGLLPGGARGSLWMTFAELAISMVTIVFAIVFLSAYLLLLQGIFASSADGGGGMKAFFIMDLLLLVGLVVFWKGRQRIKAAAERLATAMSKRPGGGGATALPQRTRFNPTEAYYKGRMAIGGARAVGRVARKTVGTAVGATAAVAGAPFAALEYANKVGNARRNKAAQQTASPSTPGERLQDRLDDARPHGGRKGQLVRMAAGAAAAYATGGTSAVFTGVVRHGTTQAAVQMARRQALAGRLRPALGGGTGNDGRGLPPGSPGPTPPPSLSGPPTPPAPGGPSTPRTAPRLPAGTGTAPASSSRTPAVVTGTVVATQPAGPQRPSGEPKADPEVVSRLRARLAQRRAIPLPGPNRD